MIDILKQWDTNLFLALNAIHNDFWDILMYYISHKFTWVPLYLWIIYYVIKKYNRGAIIIVFFILVLVTLTDQTSVQVFKNVFQRLRPCHNPVIAHLVHLVNGKCGGQFGFVSSHAANVFGLTVFTSLLFNRRIILILLLSWAFLVSYSRIYLGVHYPGDILCGGLLGSAIAVIVFKIYVIVDYRLKKNFVFFRK